MSRTFKGRVVLSGAVKGEAAVSRQGFNTLATYYAGMADRSPLCHDQGNPDLYKKPIAGKIILGWGAKFGPEGSSIIGSPSGNPE